MDLNQKKATEILGRDMYNSLLEKGFVPIEISTLKLLLNTRDEIVKIAEKLT